MDVLAGIVLVMCGLFLFFVFCVPGPRPDPVSADLRQGSFEIHTENFDTMLGFYRDVLGFAEVPEGGGPGLAALRRWEQTLVLRHVPGCGAFFFGRERYRSREEGRRRKERHYLEINIPEEDLTEIPWARFAELGLPAPTFGRWGEIYGVMAVALFTDPDGNGVKLKHDTHLPRWYPYIDLWWTTDRNPPDEPRRCTPEAFVSGVRWHVEHRRLNPHEVPGDEVFESWANPGWRETAGCLLFIAGVIVLFFLALWHFVGPSVLAWFAATGNNPNGFRWIVTPP